MAVAESIRSVDAGLATIREKGGNTHGALRTEDLHAPSRQDDRGGETTPAASLPRDFDHRQRRDTMAIAPRASFLNTAFRVNRSLPSVVAAGRLNDAVPDRQWRRNTRLSAVSVLTAGLRSRRNSGHAGIGAVERRRRRWGRLRRRRERRDTRRNRQKCSRSAKHCSHPFPNCCWR